MSEPLQAVENTNQGTRQILVVDDDPSIRLLLRVIFESAGYAVTEAQHGRAALTRIETELPDVVVTDLKMPVMGGGALIEHLRSDPRSMHLPIVAVTADRNAKEVARKANAILRKPFHYSTLIETVDGLLEERALKAG
jgi:CheY-like chemotaxis protein